MGFDIVGFAEAAPGANGKIAAPTDSIYHTSGDDLFIKPEKPYLLGVFSALQSTGAAVKIDQPSLKNPYYFIKSFQHGLYQLSDGWHHLFGRPLPLVPGEKLNVEAVNATDEDALVGLILGSSRISQAMLDSVNPTHRITGYSDTTVVANAWSTCPITWDEDLPAGRYAVVGMRVGCWLTGAITEEASIARLIMPEASNERPGVPALYMGADHEEYQIAGVEPWVDWPFMPEVSFTNLHMPNIEVLSQQAWTDEEVELMLQRIG